ncbi:hypothetical protein BN1080_01592 [Planococcus massiliensis]|uniref:Uncharacterized protein n=1 Tax=Planococcus massiliensis TaxID=1499687 RepID=A0A098EJY8_9BACL|nr:MULTISPECIES: hypothetical protein [Planococcus]MCJ1907423.1 hypothetical protein [Planococcus ruber]CEG22659.1 hypothetical protein BN1080_01592 [Planococcus massiliensis]
MNSEKAKKNAKYNVHNDSAGLSFGVAHMSSKPLDKERSPFWDFITQTFLFILGGVILCGMLYLLVSFT